MPNNKPKPKGKGVKKPSPRPIGSRMSKPKRPRPSGAEGPKRSMPKRVLSFAEDPLNIRGTRTRRTQVTQNRAERNVPSRLVTDKNGNKRWVKVVKPATPKKTRPSTAKPSQRKRPTPPGLGKAMKDTIYGRKPWN